MSMYENIINSLESGARTTPVTLSNGERLFEANISPSVAMAILTSCNTANIRKLKRTVVVRYATEMLSGDWGRNLEPIILRKDGTLDNGQHRLSAVVQSGVSCPFLVITNAEHSGRKAIDRGAKRTITETHGVPAHSASVVRMLLRLERGSRMVTDDDVDRRWRSDYDRIQTYESTLARRPLFREGFIAAAFAFAESHKPEEKGAISDLAEDISGGEQEYAASKLIVSCVMESKRVRAYSQEQRLVESVKILHGIQAHILGAEPARLSAHVGVVRWFYPDSQCKIVQQTRVDA